MESYRRSYRMIRASRRRQAGITALGFLILAIVFGTVGFAALKVTPMYLQGMRIQTVLSDLKTEMDGKGATANNLRMNLSSRMYVEGIALGPDSISITPGTNGYAVRVQYDNRSRFLSNIYFLVAVDEQIEIRR